MSDEGKNILRMLDKPPRESRGFLWADYAELRCLTSIDGYYGEGQVIDLETEPELHADDDTSDQDSGLSDESEENVESVSEADQASKRWSDIAKRLASRQHTMAGFWPFEFISGVLYKRFDESNSRHRLYITLLLASALRYCKKDRHAEIAASLEEIGYYLFKSIMPQGWQVKPFGAHQTISDGYEGKFADKLHALAKDVSAKFVAPASDFDTRNTGDGGLDVVAWHALGDSPRGYIPVAYAQCGCSPGDWEHKQFESSPVAMELKILPHHPASSYYIMPHDLRSLSGGWERGDHIGRVVLIDRMRILKLAEQYDLEKVLPQWGFVDEAANYKVALI